MFNPFAILFVDILEKFRLRKWQGVSKATNIPYAHRNKEFYSKVEKRIAPVLVANGYRQLRKRRFIKIKDDRICFYEFNTTKRYNSIYVVYGSVCSDKVNDEDISGYFTPASFGEFEKDYRVLKPSFWKYHYEYPVRKDDSKDELILTEMEFLINQSLQENAQCG